MDLVLNAHEQAVLAEYQSRLLARFPQRIRRIALFGSRARGEAGPESDVDVLVVLGEEITWLRAMAQAVLRAFAWTEGQPMRSLAATLGISPQTLYTTLRLVVQAMLWVRRGQASATPLASRLQEVQARLAAVEHALTLAQAEVERLTRVLADAQAQVNAGQVEVARLQAHWTVMQDRLIVVLKMSGRCTVRSMVEVLEHGLGVYVSVGYVQGVIAQASVQAHSVWECVLQVVPLSGAVCLDEVFFKEMACQVLGIVIVDPLSRASILLVSSQLLSYWRDRASGRTRLPASRRSLGRL